MTQDKQIAKLEKKITDLKVMKKSARSLQKKRDKFKMQLRQTTKALTLIRTRVRRFINIKLKRL
jgi:DNA repair ATPase RecN